MLFAGGSSVWLPAVPAQAGNELSAPSALARRGLRPDVARPGTKLVVKGYRAKNGTPRARVWYVTLPDGRSLNLTLTDGRGQGSKG